MNVNLRPAVGFSKASDNSLLVYYMIRYKNNTKTKNTVKNKYNNKKSL